MDVKSYQYNKKYAKKYYEKNKKKMIKYTTKYHRQKRQDIIKLLGGKCIKCGYSGSALQIDHINSDGWKEKRNINSYVYKIYKKILNGSKDYQLLCANCNWEKRNELKEYNHWERLKGGRC